MEILFRGKDVQGRWFYGNLTVLDPKYHGSKGGSYLSNSTGSPLAYKIRPETVGQYIGIKGTDGNKIFDDDILHVLHEDGAQFYSKVEYFADIGYPSFDIKFPNGFYFESNVIMEAITSGVCEVLVVGNIYDNPELLHRSEIE